MRLHKIRRINAKVSFDDRNLLSYRVAKVQRIMVGCLY